MVNVAPAETAGLACPHALAESNALRASAMPPPHNASVQSRCDGFGRLVVPVGKARAVFLRMSFTACGVSAGFTESMRLAIPVTCAAEMLVPLRAM